MQTSRAINEKPRKRILAVTNLNLVLGNSTNISIYRAELNQPENKRRCHVERSEYLSTDFSEDRPKTARDSSTSLGMTREQAVTGRWRLLGCRRCLERTIFGSPELGPMARRAAQELLVSSCPLYCHSNQTRAQHPCLRSMRRGDRLPNLLTRPRSRMGVPTREPAIWSKTFHLSRIPESGGYVGQPHRPCLFLDQLPQMLGRQTGHLQ